MTTSAAQAPAPPRLFVHRPRLERAEPEAYPGLWCDLITDPSGVLISEIYGLDGGEGLSVTAAMAVLLHAWNYSDPAAPDTVLAITRESMATVPAALVRALWVRWQETQQVPKLPSETSSDAGAAATPILTPPTSQSGPSSLDSPPTATESSTP